MISDRILLRVLRSEPTVALIGDLVRAVVAIAAIGLVAWYLAYYVALVKVMFHDLHMNDFGKFYYSARALLDGDDMYASNAATAMPVGNSETREFANLNPPHFHLLVLPIARLDPLAALVVWALVSLLAFGVSLRVITHELDVRWTPAGALWALLGVLVSSPMETLVFTGQVTFLLMLPVTLTWAHARRDRWMTAAIWLGPVVSIKPLFAILAVAMLARQQVKAVILMTLVAAGCVGIGLALFGWSAYASWLRILTDVQWTWAVMNGSLTAPLARTLGDNPFFAPLVRAPYLIRPIATAGSMLVLGVSCLAVARDSGPNAVDRSFALLILAALLASPLGWIYYVWLALPPLAALWMRGAFNQEPIPLALLWLAAPGLIYSVQLTLLGQSHPWGALIPGSIYTWTTICLWAAVLVSRTAPAPSPTSGR